MKYDSLSAFTGSDLVLVVSMSSPTVEEVRMRPVGQIGQWRLEIMSDKRQMQCQLT